MATSIPQRSGRAAPEAQVVAEVTEHGFCSPIALLTAADCAAFERHAARGDLPAPLSWHKGRAATDPAFHEIATRPEIIARLRPLLGDDIVLWGASIVHRPPGTRHPWHSDMESAAPDARAVSAWIGLAGTADSSGLRFIPGSHRYGHPVQEVLVGLGEERNNLTDARMAEIARAFDPAARIVEAGAHDGELVLFDGRVWHCGYNERATGTRTALLLQYAAAAMPVPMPAGRGYEWPLRFAETPRVPTILVSGSGRHSANRLVPPPQKPAPDAPMIRTVARTSPFRSRKIR